MVYYQFPVKTKHKHRLLFRKLLLSTWGHFDEYVPKEKSIRNFFLPQELFTISHKYGTSIKAIPADTLLAPTPIFLIIVGYNSAVNTGIIAFDELIVKRLIIARVVMIHWRWSDARSMGIVQPQAAPDTIMVKAKGQRRPPFNKIRILRATAGISTEPDKI